jgi:hypothetical protein
MPEPRGRKALWDSSPYSPISIHPPGSHGLHQEKSDLDCAIHSSIKCRATRSRFGHFSARASVGFTRNHFIPSSNRVSLVLRPAPLGLKPSQAGTATALAGSPQGRHGAGQAQSLLSLLSLANRAISQQDIHRLKLHRARCRAPLRPHLPCRKKF